MSELTDLYQEIARCQACDLARSRNRVVPGEGPESVAVMFIGEAPGWHEDQQGRPFVGPAGKFLDELLSSIGMKRSEVYIANVIKCRPPSNRDPLPGEIQACRKWLERQIEMVKPKIIVTLGRYSAARYFPGEQISRIHGIARKLDNVICYPMYHPAAALHQRSLQQSIESDMLKIPKILAQMERVTEGEMKAQQLSMF